MQRVMGIVVMLTVTVGIGFMMAALLIPGKLMSLFTKDEQMIEQAVPQHLVQNNR